MNFIRILFFIFLIIISSDISAQKEVIVPDCRQVSDELELTFNIPISKSGYHISLYAKIGDKKYFAKYKNLNKNLKLLSVGTHVLRWKIKRDIPPNEIIKLNQIYIELSPYGKKIVKKGKRRSFFQIGLIGGGGVSNIWFGENNSINSLRFEKVNNFHVGILVRMNFFPQFYFQTNPQYIRKGYITTTGESINWDYIEIPLLLSIGNSIRLNSGGYWALFQDQQSEEIEGIKNVDYGALFGFTIETKSRNFGLTVTLSSSLRSILDDSISPSNPELADKNIKNFSAIASIFYSPRLKKKR